MAGERTEKPSPRRLQKAREEGRFVSSRELVAGVQFGVAVWLIVRGAPGWFSALGARWRLGVERAFAPGELGLNGAAEAWRDLLVTDLTPLWMASLAMAAAALAAQMLVSGFGFATGNLAPDFNRLNPGPRLKEIGLGGLRHAAVALLLLGLLVAFGEPVLRGAWENFAPLSRSALGRGLRETAAGLALWLERAAWLFLVLGLIDWARQYRRYHDQLSMTKQEVRDEMKETEGNPQIKQKLRRLQREFSRRRMMADVEKATAVIVNPTHYAVALRYDLEGGAAPKVVGKGKNYLALRIRQRAERAGVPIVENPPLARALYGSVKIGQEIPAHLYRAVAEVLAYVYRLMGGRLPGQSY